MLHKKLLKTLAAASCFICASASYAATSVIDVMVVHTPGTATAYSGDPTTRINQLFQLTNQIYKDSNVELELRLVKVMQVDYTDDNSAETALDAITNGTGVFSTVAAAREQAKADMVIFYRPYKDAHASCGLAWIGGSGTNGDFSATYIKKYMFSHIAINTCADYVTAHELGHNMGLRHSRKQDGAGGTFPYALGYGVDGKFTTVMAYPTSFNVDYWTGTVYKFSSPELTCKNLPCGVLRTNGSTGADARYAISVTGPQIANFFVGASQSNSSVASSATSSSANSSTAVIDLNEANARLAAAKAAYDTAVAALEQNKIAVAARTKEEAAKKALLTTATTNLTKAKAIYDAAIKKYSASTTVLKTMEAKIKTAQDNYNKATTNAAKEAAAKVYNAAVLAYQQKVSQVISEYNAAIAAQNALATATSAVVAATNTYNAAKTALATEKARTTELTAKVKSTLATYTAAQKLVTSLSKAKK